MRGLAAGVGLALALLHHPASADPAKAALDGLVEHPLPLSAAALAALPPVELDVSFQTGHGPETAHYAGALLWSLVEQAGLKVEPGSKRSSLHHYLLVTGQDGYAVIIATGEIDPDFEGKQAILAYAKDGKPLEDLRMIVPGDKHGGRAVHDVAHIEVK